MQNKSFPFHRFQPSLFLLGLIHLLLIPPVAIFLDWQYLIPALALTGAMSLFLLFGCEKRLFLSLPLAPLPPDDPWKLHFFLKKSPPPLPVTLYLIKTPVPLSLCLGGAGFCRIVFSEKLLEMLSPEEREVILSYYVRAGDRGWIFFLTLVSAILKGLNGFLIVLNLPDRIFRKKQKNESGFSADSARLQSFFTQNFSPSGSDSERTKPKKTGPRPCGKCNPCTRGGPSPFRSLWLLCVSPIPWHRQTPSLFNRTKDKEQRPLLEPIPLKNP